MPTNPANVPRQLDAERPPGPGGQRIESAEGGHAVVIGGSVGGLLAARAVRGRYGRVTIVERDRDLGLTNRKGVPQGRCLHVLMAGGLAVFERLFPGFGDGLTAAGAIPFDFGEQSALRFPHGWLPRFRSGITTYACSRALLEAELRRRVREDPAIEVRPGHTVSGLVARDGRVVGVRVHAGAEQRVLEADLVVVADGGGSALPAWLGPLGVPPPETTVIESQTLYTSAWFEIPDDQREHPRFIAIGPAEGGPLRSGALFEAEGRRWGVVLLRPTDEASPVDHAGFLRAAGELADGRLLEAIAHARPLSSVHRYGRSKNRIYHYERSERWPDGLVAIGDAVCMLDPYFGLGMTACARGVAELRACLSEGEGEPEPEPGGARRFQQRLAQTNADPWELVTGRDRTGRYDPGRAVALRCLHRLAPRSPAVARVLLERMHLLASPDIVVSSPVAELIRRELSGELPSDLPSDLVASLLPS